MATDDSTMTRKEKLFIIIFHAHTPWGKAFDIALIFSIIISVVTVMLDSVASLHAKYGDLFFAIEWFFTILFTLEYFLRIYCIRTPVKYIFSFYGIVDLLSIIPSYLSLLVPGAHYLLVIRVLRVMRVFRVLKLAQYVDQADLLIQAIRLSRQKIIVFLFSILVLVVIFGCMMYLIEGEKNGYTSIPRSVYWAVVTLTTVGYGDISPQTDIGQALAAMVMVMGYAIIAVPTGIFTAELANVMRLDQLKLSCTRCGKSEHEKGSHFCNRCGSELPETEH